jgi:hypothetical protein
MPWTWRYLCLDKWLFVLAALHFLTCIARFARFARLPNVTVHSSPENRCSSSQFSFFEPFMTCVKLRKYHVLHAMGDDNTLAFHCYTIFCGDLITKGPIGFEDFWDLLYVRWPSIVNHII